MELHPAAALAKQPEGGLGTAVADFMDQLNEKVQNRAVAMLRRHRARSIVEVGFGAGGLADKLYEAGISDRYVGVEISSTMVRNFNLRHKTVNKKSKAPSPPFEAVHASVELMPLRAEQFDVAIAMNTIYWWNNPLAGLREIHRILKPSGILLIGMVLKTDIPPTSAGQKGGPVHYSEDQLAKMVHAAGFIPGDFDAFVDTPTSGVTRAYALAIAEAN